MTEILNPKQYDLEERTFKFTKKVIEFCKKLPKTVENIELIKQEIRASGSVGANYIEANEALSKKDFQMRIKICRKEAKESRYWSKLIVETNKSTNSNEDEFLIQEATEFIKIFNSILTKSK